MARRESDVLEESQNRLLDRCPLCKYALFGLPSRHKCPERGLDIDRRWHLIHEPSALQTAITGAAILAISAYVIVRTWRVFPTMAAVMLVCVAGLLLLSWMRRRYWVVLAPTGIRRYASRRLVAEIRWSEFCVARLDPRSGIELIDSRGN